MTVPEERNGAGDADACADANAEDLHWLVTPPPSDGPWDLPFAQAPLVFLDCEMTGTDPQRDALIEVAARRVRGGVLEDEFSTLVKAGSPSGAAAFATHGIDDALVRTAPPFAQVADRLGAVLRGAVPVAHGTSLDRAFLNNAFAAAGSELRLAQMLDTVVLARRAVLAGSYRLAVLAEHLGVTPRRWHRTAEDVAALGEILQKLVALLRPVTARDLWQVRAGVCLPVQVRDVIARRLERARDGKALALVVRQPGREPRRLVGRILRWESPHITLGLGASGRVRGVAILRADRVLHIEEPG